MVTHINLTLSDDTLHLPVFKRSIDRLNQVNSGPGKGNRDNPHLASVRLIGLYIDVMTRRNGAKIVNGQLAS